MLESGTPLSVVTTIMGWRPSTTVRMSRRYGHIGQAAQVEAVKALEGIANRVQTAVIKRVAHQNGNQIQNGENAAAVTQ
jgi:hypothetical protein